MLFELIFANGRLVYNGKMNYLRMSCHHHQNPGYTDTRNFPRYWNTARSHDKKFLRFHIRRCLHKDKGNRRQNSVKHKIACT